MDAELIAYLDRRFEAIDHRFEAIDHRFEQIDHRFGQIDHRFDQIDLEIRKAHILIEATNHNLELVAEGVVANRELISDLRSDFEHQFEEVKAVNRLSYTDIDRRLREHDRRISDLEVR